MPNFDSTADLKWASDALSAACINVPSTLQLDIRLYVSRAVGLVPTLAHSLVDSLHTSAKGLPSDISTTVEELSTQGHITHSRREHLRVQIGRPDIPVIIQEEIAASTGPISINGEPSVTFTLQILTRSSIQPAALPV
jgi:hypothetical protein